MAMVVVEERQAEAESRRTETCERKTAIRGEHYEDSKSLLCGNRAEHRTAGQHSSNKGVRIIIPTYSRCFRKVAVLKEKIGPYNSFLLLLIRFLQKHL